MAVKPYQSSLIPYEEEIIDLRLRRPPMPYGQIAELLRQKYNLTIQRAAIFKFIKVRSRGRKVYSYQRNPTSKRTVPVQPSRHVSDSGHDSPPNTKFEFTYSDRYNLTRLSPEEAAALKKKLEEERH